MQAWLCENPIGVEALAWKELPTPEPKAGEVRVKLPGGEEQSFFVGGGALEVQPSKVTVLADTALRAKDLDENAALAAKQRAEEMLAKATDKIGEAEAMKEIVRMAEQVKMIQRLRKGK